MNMQTRYQIRQAAYAAAVEDFEKWTKPRVEAHLYNARTILRKYNRNRRAEDIITPKGYEWAGPHTRGHKITGYTPTHITIQYATGPWNKPELHTYQFPITDLSLSTWDYNKRLREAIREAEKERVWAIQRSYADKIAQAARDLKEQEKRLTELREERDKAKARQETRMARIEARKAKKLEVAR